MKQTLNELDKTSVLLQKHIDTYSNKISLSHFDFFCCVSSYKHLQLVKGFSLLIRQNNYPSAVPVFLEHVNLCLQIYASTLIKYHPNLFAKKMINNNKLNYQPNLSMLSKKTQISNNKEQYYFRLKALKVYQA